LARSGITVHVLAGAGKYAAGKTSVQFGESWSFSVERLRSPYDQKMGEARRIWSFLAFAIASTFKVLEIRPSLVYASSTPLSVGIPAVVSKVLLRSRMIFEVRDLWPSVPIALGFLRNPLLRWIAGSLEALFYRCADSIFVLSPGMVPQVNRSLTTKKAIHLLPNISDFEFFAQGTKAPLDRGAGRAIDPGSNFIVYAGSFGHSNGTSYLPLIAKGLSEKGVDTSVVAVGQGSHFYETIAIARELGVLDVNYYQFNPIPANNVPGLFARADAMISVFSDHPGLLLNSANKFFDGLAAGLPIISNYGGWQSTLITDEGLGLVLGNPLLDYDLLRLAEFLTNRKWLAQASKAAIKVGQAYFSLEKFEQHLSIGVPLKHQCAISRQERQPSEVCSHPTCRKFLD
jgi:glycosyltransferase involved in cell wall biosynthesis